MPTSHFLSFRKRPRPPCHSGNGRAPLVIPETAASPLLLFRKRPPLPYCHSGNGGAVIRNPGCFYWIPAYAGMTKKREGAPTPPPLSFRKRPPLPYCHSGNGGAVIRNPGCFYWIPAYAGMTKKKRGHAHSTPLVIPETASPLLSFRKWPHPSCHSGNGRAPPCHSGNGGAVIRNPGCFYWIPAYAGMTKKKRGHAHSTPLVIPETAASPLLSFRKRRSRYPESSIIFL